LAEQCDLAGQHRDAVEHLARAARRKDVEATTRLGKRLLIGDRAPHLPNDGAGLLMDASRLGGAEAAALLSVLFAVGGSREHDLQSALESLVAAAERGWAPAQSQLRVLAGREDAGHGGEAPAGGSPWQALAAAIDMTVWKTSPASSDLHETPLIRSFANFIGAPVCRWLIDRARGRLSRALVYDAVVKKTTEHPTRNNTAALFNLIDTDLVGVLVQVRMAACLGMPFRHLEPMAVLHYAAGEEITEHFDFVDPNVPDYDNEIAQNGQRVVTFLVYLNDDYADGETEFPRLGISHKGRRGEAVFFVNALADGSSDVRTLHAGRPPRAGEKWIVSQFVRNHPTF
jgi:prolyl 4-hydroxylase